MWLAPLGITCLICGNLLEVDNFGAVAQVSLRWRRIQKEGLFVVSPMVPSHCSPWLRSPRNGCHSHSLLRSHEVNRFPGSESNSRFQEEPDGYRQGNASSDSDGLWNSLWVGHPPLFLDILYFRGAVLPTSMQCLEDNCKVDRRVSRFVLPLGSTINMVSTFYSCQETRLSPRMETLSTRQ